MTVIQSPIAIALLSAVVAFGTTMLVRWIDQERPVWKLVTADTAYPDAHFKYFSVAASVVNVGNGTVYDVQVRELGHEIPHSQSRRVVSPGDSLELSVYINAAAGGETDSMGDPLPINVTTDNSREVRVRVEWRQAPRLNRIRRKELTVAGQH